MDATQEGLLRDLASETHHKARAKLRLLLHSKKLFWCSNLHERINSKSKRYQGIYQVWWLSLAWGEISCRGRSLMAKKNRQWRFDEYLMMKHTTHDHREMVTSKKT